MRRLAWIVLLASLMVLVLAACGGGDDGDVRDVDQPVPPAPTTIRVEATSVPSPAAPAVTPTALSMPVIDRDPATRAELRIIHASPDLPAVNLFLDGASIGKGFTLGQFHATPLTYAAGRYTLRILPVDSDGGPTVSYLDYTLDLAPRDKVIALIVGTADALRIVLYQENLDPLPRDMARITLLNAIPKGPRISLQEANQTLLRDVYFGTTSDPVEIPAGQHTFTFGSGADVLATTDLRLAGRMAYTFLIVGAQAEPDYQVITLQARVNDVTRARFIHASPDLPTVDAYLNDELVVRNLDFRDSAEWANYPSQTVALRLMPVGTVSAEPLFESRLTLSPDRAVNIVLLDAANRLQVVQFDEDLSPTPTNGARLLFIHAAIGPAQVAIQTYGGAIPGLTPISFGMASSPVTYSAGPDAFFILDAHNPDTDPVDYLSETEWKAGTAYTIVITGYPDTEPLVLETEVGTEQTLIAAEGLVTLEPPSIQRAIQIRLINALPGTTPIDLDLDGQPVFQDVARGTATVYREFATLPASLVVRDSQSQAVLVDETLSISGGETLTLFIFQDETGVRHLLAPDAPFNLSGGQAQLRVFNAAYNKPDLQLTREDRSLITPTAPVPQDTPAAPQTPAYRIDVSLSDPLQFGLPSAVKAVPAGTYDVRIIESQTSFLVHTIRDITFEDGASYDLIILPDASDLNVNTIMIPHARP